jgi:hypothetical protein
MQIKNYTNHKLLMESGRWNNIDRANTICTKSDNITIGDEYHYIMKCQHFLNFTILQIYEKRQNILKF